MRRGSMRIIIVLVVVFVLLLAVVLYPIMFLPQSRNLMLSKDVGAPDEIRFVCPPGHLFRIVFGYPHDQKPASAVRGSLILSHAGTKIREWEIDGSSLREANGLHSFGLSGLVWWPDDSRPGLNEELKVGEEYEITIRMDNEPKMSLWLHYLATRYEEMRGAAVSKSP